MKPYTMLFIITVMWAVALVACQKKTMFSPGACYSVKELLLSKEAKVACDEEASFEGSTLCLTGILEMSNDPRPLPQNFFLKMAENPSRAVEVQLNEEVAAVIIPQVQANLGKAAKLVGTVNGFGHAGNPDCKRAFILQLSNAADFRLE